METTVKQSEISFSTVWAGFSLVSNLFTLSDAKILPFFLMGKLDNELLVSFFYKHHERLPESIEEAQQCEIAKFGLDNLKNHVRTQLQRSFNQLGDQVQKPKQYGKGLKSHEVRQKFQEQNKVSEFGTVSEIAEKYNISKKQVRELKRDGKLEDFIKSKE